MQRDVDKNKQIQNLKSEPTVLKQEGVQLQEIIDKSKPVSENPPTLPPEKPAEPPIILDEITSFQKFMNVKNLSLTEGNTTWMIWEKPGARVVWVLGWKRSFHMVCLESMSLKKIVNNEEIMCENCILLQQQCAFCGALGMISPNKFRKCSVEGCQYYFHVKCEKKLMLSLYYKKVTSKDFVCPTHYCGKWKEEIDPSLPDLMSCVRCYQKYHNDWKDPKPYKLITQTQMVWFRHKIQEEKTERLEGIFERRQTTPIPDPVLFSDPPLNPGNKYILRDYKRRGNSTELPVQVPQDFDIIKTIEAMQSQLNAAIEQGNKILQSSKGINLIQERN